MASDGAGGAIAVWRDFRNYAVTEEDIYAQRVTAEGKIPPGWPTDGVPVVTEVGFQYGHDIIPDGQGGAYVAWYDARGPWAIYMLRLTADGAIAPGWAVNGVPVCAAPVDQREPKLAPDGEGGAFVAWEDHRVPGDVYFYAQRMTPDGQRHLGWPADGLPVCMLPGNRGVMNAISDGQGGLFVEWADTRHLGTSGADIYAVRITADGGVAPGWVADGIPLCAAPGNQNVAALAQDGEGGLIVVWQDQRSLPPGGGDEFYYTDLYAQRMTASGTIAPGWPENGVPVCTAPDYQVDHQVVSDGAGGAIVCWEDYRNRYTTNSDVYAQRILASGAIASGWPVDGMSLSHRNEYELEPTMVADGVGGALVAYQTQPGRRVLYAQHVTASGAIATGWDPNGTPVCAGSDVVNNADAVSDGATGMIVAWEDGRNQTGDWHIYAQHVTSDFPTPTLPTLLEADAEAGRVVLTWSAEGVHASSATVYRRSDSTDWVSLGAPQDAGNGKLTYDDRDVAPRRYAYRLGYPNAGVEVFTAESWVTVPAAHVLAVTGFRPNPVRGTAAVSLSLASGEAARLSVFDASGRAVVTREIGSLGAGPHVVALDGVRLRPGLYWIRVSQSGQSLTARGIVVQ